MFELHEYPTKIAVKFIQGNNVDSYHANSLKLYQQGQFEDAIIELHKAANLNNQYHPLIHFNGSHLFLDKADCLAKLNQNEKAQAAYQHAIFLEHDNKSAILKKPLDNNELSPYPKSVPLWLDYHQNIKLTGGGYLFNSANETIELTLPDKMQAHDKAYKLMELGKFEQAVTILQKLDDCYLSQHHLAQALTKISDLESALEAFDRASEIYSHHHIEYHEDAAWQFYNRACLYAKLEQFEMAYNDFHKAVSLNKNHKKAKENIQYLSQNFKNLLDAIS